MAFHCSNVQTDTFSHGIGETDSLEYSLTSDATAPSDAISGSVDTGARTKLCPSCHTHAVTRHKSGAPTSARKKLVLVQRKDCVGKGAVRLEWNIPFSQDPASRPSLSINFEDIAHIPPFSIQYRTSTLRTRHDRAARQILVASPSPLTVVLPPLFLSLKSQLALWVTARSRWVCFLLGGHRLHFLLPSTTHSVIDVSSLLLHHRFSS